MHLSTRGRYAVMALLDLAQLQEDGLCGHGRKPVTLAQIAERQDLSLSYLEQLFSKLRRAGLVSSVRGPGGGYVLARKTAETWLHDIIKAVDETTDVTRCHAHETQDGEPRDGGCVFGGKCNAHNLWLSLGRHVEGFFKNINLDMVLSGHVGAEFKPTNI